MKVNSGETSSEINRTVIFTLVKAASSRLSRVPKSWNDKFSHRYNRHF